VGTHDNDTGRGWYENADPRYRQQADRYLNRRDDELPSHALNRGIAESVCDICIYTMQDLLNLGNEARINTPSTIGGNWEWRMNPGAITQEVRDSLTDLTELYFREREDEDQEDDDDDDKTDDDSEENEKETGD